jgi:hypothetical protein
MGKPIDPRRDQHEWKARSAGTTSSPTGSASSRSSPTIRTLAPSRAPDPAKIRPDDRDDESGPETPMRWPADMGGALGGTRTPAFRSVAKLAAARSLKVFCPVDDVVNGRWQSVRGAAAAALWCCTWSATAAK